MTKSHYTIENVSKLAKLIVKKTGLDFEKAEGLAEFNLKFSSSYKEAASRV